MVATYEYDAYGNVTASAGDFADENPFRFSTKYWDDETGLGYWGYRYYSARLGRWISRDPLEEEAGPNLNIYIFNDPGGFIDYLGQRQYSYEFNLSASAARFSFYGRVDVADDSCGCIDVAGFVAAEWQPPTLRWIRKPLNWANINIETGVRGGLKIVGKWCPGCGGCISSVKVCGRFEVFARAEYRKSYVQELGGRRRFTRARFGAGADGGADLCWNLCNGDVTLV